MQGLTRRWIGPSGQGALPDADAPSPGTHVPLLERVMRVRGLGGVDRAERLLRNPRQLSLLHDAGTLPGADAVAARLEEAVRAGKRIAIYGDYDADGITALAVLWHVLRSAAPASSVELFAPSRFEHGYGLHSDVLRQMHARGVQTVVTVDCGITGVQQARVARELGMQLLITDHHLPDLDAQGRAELPDADAIAHPALPGACAPFAELCGAAVVYKVATQFARRWCGGERIAEVMQQALSCALPLVALGTVADVVPLVDENRVFVAVGLGAIQSSGIPGLRALLDDAQLTAGTTVDSEHVAFRLAPRLNAVGRLGRAAEAVELLTTADGARAREIAKALSLRNEERRRIEAEIFAQACALVERRGADQSAIVLAQPDWHEGVVGVVCSKLVDRFHRPAVLLCVRPDGTAKGSGRGPDGFDLAAAVRACSGHLEACGGHSAAAGLTLKSGAHDAFAREFAGQCAARMQGVDMVPRAHWDTRATLAEMNRASLASLDMLRPYGRGNREPAVHLAGLRVAAPPRAFGAARTHLEVHVKGEGLPPRSATVRAVWWNGAQHAAAIGRAGRFDAIARPKLDEWRGSSQVQLDLVDVALATAPIAARA